MANRELQVQVLPPEGIAYRGQSSLSPYIGTPRWLHAVSLHPLIASVVIVVDIYSWFIGRGVGWWAAAPVALAVWFGQQRLDGDSKALSALKAAIAVALIQAPLFPNATLWPEWAKFAYAFLGLAVFAGAGSIGLRSRLAAARGYEASGQLLSSRVAVLAALVLLIFYPLVGNVVRGGEQSERTRSWTKLLQSERLDTAPHGKKDEDIGAQAAQVEQELDRDLGVWEDPSTGLIWPQAGDNGANVNYQSAVSYCEGLDLDGGGWQLPTAHQLEWLDANKLGQNDYWTRLAGESHGVATAEVYVATRNGTDDWPKALEEARALCVKEGRF